MINPASLEVGLGSGNAQMSLGAMSEERGGRPELEWHLDLREAQCVWLWLRVDERACHRLCRQGRL